MTTCERCPDCGGSGEKPIGVDQDFDTGAWDCDDVIPCPRCSMPDHPSWPAELVEKAAVHFALAADPDADWLLHWGDKSRERFREHARRLLSALSGDLVPREERCTCGAGAGPLAMCQHDDTCPMRDPGSVDDEVEVPWSLPTSDSPAIELVPRSQADALAEALEAVARLDDEADAMSVDRAMMDAGLVARSALASYRKTASGETEG